MSPGKRISASQPPLNFQHPYLHNKIARRPQKRELGIIDLFVFKMFGCFTPDDLPPPNPNATVYQAGARTSSTTLTSSGTVPLFVSAPPPSNPNSNSTTSPKPLQTENHQHHMHQNHQSSSSPLSPPQQSPSTPPPTTSTSAPTTPTSVLPLTQAALNQDGLEQLEQQFHPNSSSSVSNEQEEIVSKHTSQHLQQFHHRRRSLRRPDVRMLRRHSSSSAWPEKMPDHASRIAVERTQFVEQRVEERKREAQRRLDEERARRAAAAAEASAALVTEDHTLLDPHASPDHMHKKRIINTSNHSNDSNSNISSRITQQRMKSINSMDSRFFDKQDSRSSGGESSQVIEQGDSILSDDSHIPASSVAGRVSRLSAMFEQQ